MSDNLNILFVSIAFPPKTDAESLQASKVYKYLTKRSDISTTVVTTRNSSSVKAMFRVDVQLNSSCIEIVNFKSKLFDAIKVRLIPELMLFPDIESRAIKGWKKAAQLIDKKPDVIISRSFPISSALIAQKLSKYFDVPWVAQMSDPWVLSSLPQKRYPKKWSKRKEREIIQAADVLTYTSKITMNKYAKEYSGDAGKMVYVPNVYDPEHRSENVWLKKDKIRIVFTGTMPESRSPKDFMLAFRDFSEKSPDKAKDFSLEFAGQASREVRKELSKFDDLLLYHGPVSFKESVALQRQADLLLLVDNKISDEFKINDEPYEFFPSKILDYIVAERPVLAITEKNSMSSSILDEFEIGASLEPHDRSGIIKELENVWASWSKNDEVFFHRKTSADFFSAKYQVCRLVKIMRGLAR